MLGEAPAYFTFQNSGILSKPSSSPKHPLARPVAAPQRHPAPPLPGPLSCGPPPCAPDGGIIDGRGLAIAPIGAPETADDVSFVAPPAALELIVGKGGCGAGGPGVGVSGVAWLLAPRCGCLAPPRQPLHQKIARRGLGGRAGDILGRPTQQG